jgi:hypothetical protein
LLQESQMQDMLLGRHGALIMPSSKEAASQPIA